MRHTNKALSVYLLTDGLQERITGRQIVRIPWRDWQPPCLAPFNAQLNKRRRRLKADKQYQGHFLKKNIYSKYITSLIFGSVLLRKRDFLINLFLQEILLLTQHFLRISQFLDRLSGRDGLLILSEAEKLC